MRILFLGNLFRSIQMMIRLGIFVVRIEDFQARFGCLGEPDQEADPMDIVDSLSELSNSVVSENTDSDPGKELLEAQKSIGDKKLQLIAESLKAARDHALCEKQALPLSNPPGEDAAALEGDGSSLVWKSTASCANTCTKLLHSPAFSLKKGFSW